MRHKTVDADNIFEARSQASDAVSTLDARGYKQVAEYGLDPTKGDSKSLEPVQSFRPKRKPDAHCLEQPNLLLKSRHENESRFSGSSAASQQVLPFPFLHGLLSSMQASTKKVTFPVHDSKEVFETVKK